MFDKNYKIDDLLSFDEKFVLHTYARKKIRFAYGIGSKLYTPCSREFIDFGGGLGTCSVGQGNEKLLKAISEQARDLICLSNLYLIEPQALLAKKLIELCGYDMRVFFSNSGAEANECAIKIARKFGQKDGKNRFKIITLDGSFHGRSMATLKASGQEKMHKNYFQPFLEGFVYAKNIDEIYRLVDSQTCGVLIELIQGKGGILPMEKQKIQELAQFLKEKNILLMVDEVQSGIYRSGEIFVSNLYEITPDVITTAKGLGGGMPIGATLSGLKDIFEYDDHGSTFGGNFLCTRAALSVLEILEEEYHSKNLSQRIKDFDTHLEMMVRDFPMLFEKKVGLGLMLGLVTKNEEIQKNIIDAAFDAGVLVSSSQRNTIRFLPALTIQKDEISEGFARLKKACETL